MEKTPAITVEHLTVNYDKTAVLWDIHFSIPPGTLVGILGPNGAGKTTLLKALLGLVHPLSGKITFLGEPFSKMRQKVAYIPQRSSVDWEFPVTVLEVVLMGRYGKIGLLRWPTLADKEAAKEALERVGLLPFAHRQINQLSGGQQQRLFLARALLQDAEIYLLDEPFAGIDIGTEKELISLLNKLKAHDKTILVVHHDLHRVESYFDWVLLLNTCLVASGPTKEVFHEQNIMRTYGQSASLLDEVAKLTQNKTMGKGER